MTGATIIDLDVLRAKQMLPEVADEEVSLDPIRAGEVVVGTLTDDERELYKAMAHWTTVLSDFGRELNARLFERAGSAIRKSPTPMDFPKQWDDETKKLFDTEADAEEFFRCETFSQLVKAQFQFLIRERFGHGSVYGVRVGFKVVRVQKKFEVVETVVKHDFCAAEKADDGQE